jgi:hypothetical protein
MSRPLTFYFFDLCIALASLGEVRGSDGHHSLAHAVHNPTVELNEEKDHLEVNGIISTVDYGYPSF